MRDLAILFIHLLATIAKMTRPGGARAVVAESLLLKHQLMVLNRGRTRAPSLRPMDRVLAGLCTLLIRPGRLFRITIVMFADFLITKLWHDASGIWERLKLARNVEDFVDYSPCVDRRITVDVFSYGINVIESRW